MTSMLRRVDRLQMAVTDRSAVAKCWSELLGAEPAGEDRIACLDALRTRLCLGNGFAESHALGAIETRARELGAGHTPEPPTEGRMGDANTLFLHPDALGGMMLGLSRPTQAWQWSGHPERVQPAAGA